MNHRRVRPLACLACAHDLVRDAAHEDAWSCLNCGCWFDEIDPEWWMMSEPPHGDVRLVRIKVTVSAMTPGRETWTYPQPGSGRPGG
jgi:hypothetical protein